MTILKFYSMAAPKAIAPPPQQQGRQASPLGGAARGGTAIGGYLSIVPQKLEPVAHRYRRPRDERSRRAMKEKRGGFKGIRVWLMVMLLAFGFSTTAMAQKAITLRQSVFGRLGGCDVVNDADRLSLDPVMRWIVGGNAVERQAASSSQMGRFEFEGYLGNVG